MMRRRAYLGGVMLALCVTAGCKSMPSAAGCDKAAKARAVAEQAISTIDLFCPPARGWTMRRSVGAAEWKGPR
jgi:hypothetical protein